MPLALDLLRHGDTGFTGFRGTLDDPLTALGWQQMESAVAGKHWDAVISSPRLRCAVFAQTYATQQGVLLKIDARLVELDFGLWEGKTAAELMQSDASALQNFWQDPERYAPPQGERMADFSVRVLQAWQEIAYEHRGRHVLVISHGGVIRRLLCHARGLPLNQLLTLNVVHGSLHTLNAKIPGKETV